MKWILIFSIESNRPLLDWYVNGSFVRHWMSPPPPLGTISTCLMKEAGVPSRSTPLILIIFWPLGCSWSMMRRLSKTKSGIFKPALIIVVLCVQVLDVLFVDVLFFLAWRVQRQDSLLSFFSSLSTSLLLCFLFLSFSLLSLSLSSSLEPTATKIPRLKANPHICLSSLSHTLTLTRTRRADRKRQQKEKEEERGSVHGPNIHTHTEREREREKREQEQRECVYVPSISMTISISSSHLAWTLISA